MKFIALGALFNFWGEISVGIAIAIFVVIGLILLLVLIALTKTLSLIPYKIEIERCRDERYCS